MKPFNSSNNDWSYKNNKALYISGGVALSTVLFQGLSWLYKRFKPVGLNLWLEECLLDIKEEYKEVKATKTYPIKFIASAMNLLQEIQNFLYLKENSDLEKQRLDAYGNEKQYEELVMETVEIHERYYQQAENVVFQKTGIDFNALKMQLQEVDQAEFKRSLVNEKKPYNDSELPKLEAYKIKEAYITYAKTFTQHTRIAAEQMIIMQRRPEYQEIAFKTIFQNKFLLKDMILIKYSIDTKYLNQLIEKHQLLEDSEVKYYYDEVKRASTDSVFR